MQKKNAAVEKPKNQTSLFITSALDMSWRLAVVVLVPIIGGFQLDKWLDLTPLLTITGFILAMIGMALVCWRTLQLANQAVDQQPKATQRSKKQEKNR